MDLFHFCTMHRKIAVNKQMCINLYLKNYRFDFRVYINNIKHSIEKNIIKSS